MRDSLWLFLLLIPFITQGQIKGSIQSNEGPLEGATVLILEKNIGVVTNKQGYFEFKTLPKGSYTLMASFVGFNSAKKTVALLEIPLVRFYLN